jgi:glycosyltransferase involved in cell wall biosynthesis
MMHLFVNCLAASAGGGLTYIRNVIPHLATTPDLRVTVALSPDLRQEFSRWNNIEFLELDTPLAKRFWFEQFRLPKLIRHCGADVLLSTGNFALRNSPIPQVLLSRNSIYTSADYYRDLRTRHEYEAWLDTYIRAAIAKRSIHWSDLTVAPSKAFADELNRWTGERVVTIHHGFDYEAFAGGSDSLAAEVEQKLDAAEGSLKLLFVSHYNYYRNFETLIRALPLLRDRLAGHSVKLLLTCNLLAGTNPGRYRPVAAAKLVQEVGASEMVVELGPIPYRQLHRLYRRSDLYVTPAYTETFAHPLVEAMASGVPVVASDLPVHREICQDAAEYFPRFSEEALAQTAAKVLMSPERLLHMAAVGMARSRDFSWKLHVQKIVELCRSLMNPK